MSLRLFVFMVFTALVSKLFDMRPTMLFVVLYVFYTIRIVLISKSWKLSTLSLIIYTIIQVIAGLFYSNHYALFIGTKSLVLTCCTLIIIQKMTVNYDQVRVKFLERDIRLILLTFIGFYIYQYTYIQDRRGLMLFDETNFELLLVILPSSYLAYNGRLKISTLFLLLSAVFLSGSRSAFFCSIPVTFLALRRWKYIFLFVAPAFITLFAKINSRLSFASIINSDRAQFFITWITELRDMTTWQLLFGKGFWTPLPISLSSRWKFYEDLFYNWNNSIAYSVLYHSGVMREVRDFGIFGGIFIYITAFYILRQKFWSFANIVLLIIMLSGFSVTSLGNIYLWIGLILIVFSFNKTSTRGVHN